MTKFRFILIILLFSSYLHGQKQTVRLLFVGDAMQHKSQIDAARTPTGFDYSSYFKHITDTVKAADIAVVNLEATLAGKPYTGYPMFSAPEQFAKALKDAGFDVFVTANNHSVDKHKKGIVRTINVLDSLGVKYTGTFRDSLQRDIYYPLMMIKNGIRIAMLNYTYDTNGIGVPKPTIVNLIDKNQIKKDIELAKSLKADIIIANMHWGEEYRLAPNKSQRELADFLIKNGVRIVIGSHPHVVQPIDIRKTGDSIESVVVYSLGNFISGMRPINTTGGLIMHLDISKSGDDLPVEIDSCTHSLIWTHKKATKGVYSFFELFPVSGFDEQSAKSYLGEEVWLQMKEFTDVASSTISNPVK